MQILLIILIAVIGILTLTGFFYRSEIITCFYDFKKWARRNWKKIGAVSVSALTIGAGIYALNIIPITKALHLDSDRNIIADIYDTVKEQDDIWSPLINHGEYIRVTFERELTCLNDITIYVRNREQIDTIVQVFLKDSDILITSFPRITYTGYYKIYLTNMTGMHDVFDLRVWNRDSSYAPWLEFDYIVDPDDWQNGDSTEDYGRWINEGNVLDGNTATFATLNDAGDGNYLEITIDVLSCDKVRIYCAGLSGVEVDATNITIDVYYSSGWHNLVTGATITKNTYTEYGIGSTEDVTKARFTDASIPFLNEFRVKVFQFNEVASNTAPTQSNELPTNQSIIIDNLPLLNVTCTDAEGNSMNATWLSNSSGSWVQFGSNETSFSNGSIQQTNSNFSADYNTTYWWSVNLTDGNGGWDNETYHFSMNGYFPYCALYFNGTDNIVSSDGDDGTLVFDIPFDIAPDKSAGTLVEVWCGSDTSSQFNSSGSYNTSASFNIDTMYCHLWQVYDPDSGFGGTEYTIGYNTTYPTPMVDLESYTFNITTDRLTYVTSNIDPADDTFNLTAFMWDVDESLALFTNTSDIYQNFTVHFDGLQSWLITNISISSFVILNVPADIWDGTDNSTDSDSDGLSDHMELNTTYGYYTDPFRSDTDNDGVSDYTETKTGSDPNNYTDTIEYTSTYNTTIRNNSIDYFIWLGDNTTAYHVYNNLTGFDEATEYVAILNNSGNWWKHIQSDGAANNWTVHTFDVVKTYLTDAVGNQTFNMSANTDITYDVPRNVTLIDIGNGYNYTGFTNTTSTALSAINTTIGFTTYYYCALWNETDFEWDFWIADFPYNTDKKVHQYDVVMTKISTDRWWEM